MSETSQAGPARYDPRSVRLHWWVALGVACQWILGRTIDWFPAGSWRVDARSTHLLVGVTVLGLLLWRLVWRLRFAPRLTPAGPSLISGLAATVHVLLYLLLIATLGLGLILEWVRGDSVFNLFKIPALDPTHREWRHQLGGIHGLFANLLLALAALHAAGALVHAVVWRDGVLSRMIPALRSRA
jgi:cytochrome b561